MGDNHTNKKEGQAMLVSMLFISSLILSATTIAGLLVLYQIRQASDVKSSAQALFAADGGIERGLFCYFFREASDVRTIDEECERLTGNFTTNRAAYISTLACRTEMDAQVSCAEGNMVHGFVVRSTGTSRNAERSMETYIRTRF